MWRRNVYPVKIVNEYCAHEGKENAVYLMIREISNGYTSTCTTNRVTLPSVESLSIYFNPTDCAINTQYLL